MSDPVENRIADLKVETTAVLSTAGIPDEVLVTFCACGERWMGLDPSTEANRHVAHTRLTRRYVVAPWLPVSGGGAE